MSSKGDYISLNYNRKMFLMKFTFLEKLIFLCFFLADPGQARGCSTNSLVINLLINSFSQSVSQPFPPTALRRRHAKRVRGSSSSYKIDYFIVIKNFLNPEGHQNTISGSTITAILAYCWSCIGKSLRLQPVQQACLENIKGNPKSSL